MAFQKEYLDLILVPSGLVIMFVYHLFLLYRYINLPHTTVMGFENNDISAWVERIMQIDKKDVKDVANPLTVISSNTTAANFLSSVCLTLSSLIGAWISNNSSNNIFQSEIIYGDTRPSTMSIKYLTLLACFLLAFACFIQSSRCFVHANYLISMPDSNIPVKFVQQSVIRGGDFWSLGLRSLYFAVNLLLWFFGPIPMFVSSVVTVILLHFLDTNTTPLHRHRSPTNQTVKRADEQISGAGAGPAMATVHHGRSSQFPN